MPVCKCFFKIMLKNRTAIMIYVILFVVMIYIMTANLTSYTGTEYTDTPVPFAVIDRDGTEASIALANYLSDRNERTELKDDTEALQDALFFRDVEYILFIPSGYEHNITTGSVELRLENVKLPSSTAGIYFDNLINRYISTLGAYLSAEYELSDALSLTAGDLMIETTVKMNSDLNPVSNEVSMISYYFSFLAYIFMGLIIITIGSIFIMLNQNDIVKRTRSSSLRLCDYNKQLAFASIISALGLWFIFMVFAYLLYGSGILTVTLALHALNSLVILAVCVSIAFLLGQFIKSSNAMGAITNSISLGMSFLCGVFVPQELLGSRVLSIAKFMPIYWYIRNNDALLNMTELNESLRKLYTEGLVIQLSFALTFFSIALIIGRYKRNNSII